MRPWKVWLAGVTLLASGCGGGSNGPPANPSAPPQTVSSPPPSTPVPSGPATAGSVAARPVPSPAQSKPKLKAVDSPPEQQFEVLEDTHNFMLESTPAPSRIFSVNTESPEGTFVAIESPEQAESSGSQSLPDGFEEIAGAGYSESGWPLRIRCVADGKEMACVPSGLFTLGTDIGTPDAGPAHPISLDTYYIDVTEVTVGEFSRFKTAMTGKDGAPAGSIPLAGNPNLPVVKLPWKDAQNYAKWAGKDLPTEAEWEKAGRGSDGEEYPWGDGRVLWHQSRTPGQIDPVGTFPHDRSRYGVFDLAGNAREWCNDWYSNVAYKEARSKDGSPAHNWTGPRKATNGERVVKGGRDRWELWARGSHAMTKPAADIGFRCVLRCGAEVSRE